MAGPGGGPPRRSHTKSRKGCVTCNNCTKHKIRCPYRDIQVPDAGRMPTPDKPDLMWTPDIERAISDWQRTGMFPFDDLRVYPTPEAHLYSVEELRLIYHAAAVYVQLAAMDANNFTVWTRHIPVLLRIGATHRYVMHALLAFSAMHIAYLTDCPLVARMALKHRGIALRGLQAAISSFSRETSDAILAASLVLSWQATDWQSWTQLMQGTLTVIKSMAAWQHESEFIDFIAETETITELPAFSNPEHRPLQPGPQDLESYREALEQILLLKEHLKQHSIEGTQVNSLVSFLKDIRKRPMLSAAQQFEYLQPLRTWLFWMPVGALQSSYESLNSLVVIAHLYTVALVMNNLFPDIGTGYFGSICLGPIEEIARHIFSSSIASPVQETFPTLTNLIEYPVEAVRKFRLRIGWPGRPEPMPCSPHFQPSDHLEVNQGQSYMPYGNPGFNYSSDSVSILISAGTQR
ncbi:Sterol regulatory element-binding protein ECM22 [Escovopsis weberi]|uniref:Sterol regulatory element-binding protein ECM22 n=1 Tax=Escovopsis weberi TaxID=150374 RepID=A0A0M8MZ02_ESCWE|nr:Sterol regulatory element-binding protein ECM22 [Escovopsis weberi]